MCIIIYSIIFQNYESMRWLTSYINSIEQTQIFAKLCELRHKYLSSAGFNIETLSQNQIFNLSSHVDSYYYMLPQTLKSTTRKTKTQQPKQTAKKITKTKGEKKSKKGGKKTRKHNKLKKFNKSIKSK